MNNKKSISVSMMCANLKNLESIIDIFERTKIEYLHIDVMDGSFVPNLGLGVDYIHSLMEITNIPFDIHLMADRPEEKIEWLGIREKDIVSIHYESTPHIQKAISKAKKYGSKVFLAINPGTPIYSVEELLDDIDGINMLMVNPGFAGQKMIRNCINKMWRMKRYIENLGKNEKFIEVDGNINYENAKLLSEYGANIFVAGSSSVFSGDVKDIEHNISAMREALMV